MRRQRVKFPWDLYRENKTYKLKRYSLFSHLYNTPCFKFSDFSTLFFFSSTCHALKTWFELSRVKLYRNDLKSNKSYLELAGRSSYLVVKLIY